MKTFVIGCCSYNIFYDLFRLQLVFFTLVIPVAQVTGESREVSTNSKITLAKVQLCEDLKREFSDQKGKFDEQVSKSETRVREMEDLRKADQLKIENLQSQMKELSANLEKVQTELDTKSRAELKKNLPKGCDDESFTAMSERRQKIYPDGPHTVGVDVLCDFQQDGGGWRVIQKRSSGPPYEFIREWAAYERGFGSLNGNFWIGLETIHALTKNQDQELRVDVWNTFGDHVYAQYSNFSIADSSDFYRLSVGGFSGTTINSLFNNGTRFHAKDRFDVVCVTMDYPRVSSTGWWYNHCLDNHLNGFYYEDGKNSGLFELSGFIPKFKVRQVEMKIRRRR